QRTVQQADALTLLVREPPAGAHAELLFGDFQRPKRNVHAGDLGELSVREQRLEELPLAAAEIEDTCSAGILQRGDDGRAALLIETQRPLQVGLLLDADRPLRSLLRVLLDYQPLQRGAGEALLMFEIAAGDGLALRMRLEPPRTVPQEFLDLVVADPVVLVIVEDRHEDVQMREQVRQALRRAQRDGEVPARTPVRVRLIERMLLGSHLVAERLEEAAQESFPASTGQNRNARLQRDRLLREFRPGLAATAEGRAVHARAGHAQGGRRGVGPGVR